MLRIQVTKSTPLAVFTAILLWASLSPGQTVEVLKNVNLRHDASSARAPIRSVKAGEALDLIKIVPPGRYYEVRTVQGEVGFAYAGSGRLRIVTEYDRHSWKHWTDADGDCQKTRDEALIAESEIPVTFKPRNDGREGKVTAGRWTGPFSGEVFTDPSDVDVDHMVPLRNAHLSGAGSWDAARKEQYANDLENAEHLIVVKDNLNQSKGARGPEAWKPPLESYHCQYANDWMSIKTRWSLTMTTAEAAAVAEMQTTCP